MEIKIAQCSVTKEILDAAGTSQTIALFEIPVNSYVMEVFGRVKTAFAGVTSPTVSVGISGNTDIYCPSSPINSVGDLKKAYSKELEYCARGTDYVKSSASKQIIGTFSSSSGNFSSLTAGEVEFVVVYIV